MIQEISTAAAEQSAGIDQVNSAVAQMDEMTQQNAALVEQATAAGEAMAGQAQGMTQLMEFSQLMHLSPPGLCRWMHPLRQHLLQLLLQGGTCSVCVSCRPGGLSVSNFDDDWEEF